MDTRQHENRNIRVSEPDGIDPEQVQRQITAPGTSAVSSSPAAVSASSSPSHEFSFTISLNTPKASSSPSVSPQTKNHQQEAPLAIDLSPADEIFFHGHLLPLHFLSHLHASSLRPSTHSLDWFSGPIKETMPFTTATDNSSGTTCSCTEDDDQYISFDNDYNVNNNFINEINDRQNYSSKERSSNNNNKSKSFSLFGLTKWKKLSDSKEKSEHPENCSRRNKLKFEVTQFLKRYINMVKPLLSPRGGRRESVRVRRQSYSFSGTVSPRGNNREVIRGRRGEFSAPASMRNSPTNSGLLLATAGVPSPSSDSTMEELQAAIQAAIAHCKNSISTHDSNNSQEISTSSSSSSSISVN